MKTARDVANVMFSIAPESLGDEPGLGIIHGSPETTVTGIACMWIASVDSIRAAVNAGANMIICHEAIWQDGQDSPWYDGPKTAEGIHGNCARRALLDHYSMVVFRSHSNWDALPQDGVPDQAVKALGIPDLKEYARQKYFSVQELPEPHSMLWLYRQAQSGLGFSACRLFGDPAKQVQRFAFLIGGFGENQYHMPQVAQAMGAEAIIIGEMSEFVVINCLQMGMPVIETLHSVSEMPAIRRQAVMLAKRIADVPVHFIPSGLGAVTMIT